MTQERMMLLIVLFADDTGLSGIAPGWAGAGLLGLVLGWLLLKGLPDQAKQTKELTEAKDRQIDQLITAKDLAVQRQTDTFKELLSKAVDSFTSAHNKSQEEFTTRNERSIESFMEISREERKICQQWHEENRTKHGENLALLNRMLTEVRENRHMMVNVLHETGLIKASDGKDASKRLYPENFGDTPPPDKK